VKSKLKSKSKTPCKPTLRCARYCLRFLISGTMLLAGPVVAQSISELTMADALAAAVSNHTADEFGNSPPYQASAWLAGLPTISVTYLGSDERMGTDETELSVNLPVKSGQRRSADRQLDALTVQLDEAGLLQRKLFYSGLIREAVWSYRLADTRRRFVADKRRLLAELEDRQRQLLAANATSEYSVLLLQMEMVQAEIAEQDNAQEARLWLARYQQITGLTSLPAESREPAVTSESFRGDQHPQLQALALAHHQRLQVLRATSAQAEDWNVSVTARNFDNPGFDEQQYGLGVEIPLSAIPLSRQTDNTEWRAAQRDYALARDQQLVALKTSWEQLLNQRATLTQKQGLLQHSAELAGRISDQLALLRDSNEIAQEIVLRRMMEAIDNRSDVAVNQILIDQNNAMLRQAAGTSL
jgi:hypothetical protein